MFDFVDSLHLFGLILVEDKTKSYTCVSIIAEEFD